ncbi:MAG: hypothetical protein NTY84_05110 [Verrucomicrobia bacterium]|nr:hypothetical protein [Verrucomicrobiota bacterium]
MVYDAIAALDVMMDALAHVGGAQAGADVLGLFIGGEFWDVSLGAVLKMKLVALPGASTEGGARCGFETVLSVGSDVVGDADAAPLEKADKVAMGFSFGEGAGDTENSALGIVAGGSDGGEGSARVQNRWVRP